MCWVTKTFDGLMVGECCTEIDPCSFCVAFKLQSEELLVDTTVPRSLNNRSGSPRVFVLKGQTVCKLDVRS